MYKRALFAKVLKKKIGACLVIRLVFNWVRRGIALLKFQIVLIAVDDKNNDPADLIHKGYYTHCVRYVKSTWLIIK